MAGCVPCFIIPLLLFIFHRYIQPILLKIWNPWEKLEQRKAEFSCTSCKWGKGGKECTPTTAVNEEANNDSLESKQIKKYN